MEVEIKKIQRERKRVRDAGKEEYTEELRGMEREASLWREKGARGMLQTRLDKGKCTYECTPDWLWGGFHGDQFARPGEFTAAAAAAAVAVATAAATFLENCIASKLQKVRTIRHMYLLWFHHFPFSLYPLISLSSNQYMLT